MESTENLADALVEICADYLGARAATADNPDTYQVVIHAGVRAITGAEPGTSPAQTAAPEPAGVSAETPIRSRRQLIEEVAEPVRLVFVLDTECRA